MKSLNKTILIIVSVVFIITSPCVVAKSMNIQLFSWMKSENDWIGFWGSYLGGFITLIGVFLTILYTREDDKKRQKLAIRPYINIEHVYNFDVTGFTATPIGFVYFEGKNLTNVFSLRINKLLILCAIKNVGLGTAINIRIKELYVENKCIKLELGGLPALQIDGNNFIRIELMEIDLQKEDLSVRFINENKRLTEHDRNQADSKLIIKFDLIFEDLFGNNLSQEFAFYIQVFEEIPTIILDESPIYVEKISSPQ